MFHSPRASKLAHIALVVVVGLVAGCGANPAGSKAVKKKAVATRPMAQNVGLVPGQVPATGVAPGVPGAPGAPNAQLQQILAQLKQAQQMPGFTARVETYDKGPKGLGSDVMQVAYKKPTTLRIEIVKGEGQAQGAKILWTGSSELKIKPSFLPMSVTKGISDSAVVSKNGWTIKDTDVNAIFRVLFDPSAQVQVGAQEQLNGKLVTLLAVRSSASPKGATSEVIAVDTATGLPCERRLYKGQELIYKLTIKNMQLKTPSSSELEV